MATHAVFSSGASPGEIKALAISYIRSVLADDGDHISSGDRLIPTPLPNPPKTTPDHIWDGLQHDLRSVPTCTLLKEPTASRRFRPRGNPEWWVARLLLGGQTIAGPAQLAKDLGLDLGHHAANLRLLRELCPLGWRRLVGANLIGLYRLAGSLPQHAGLIQSVVLDHAVLTGVVRARLLGEYLRRLATEPMGPRLAASDPLWAKRSALFVDRLANPAKSLTRLLSILVHGSTQDMWKHCIASGQLAHDPRLLPLATRIYRQIGAGQITETAGARLVSAVRTAISPLAAITSATLRDEGFGRQDFALAQLGLSVPEAVTVLAINLVCLRGQVQKALAALDSGAPLPTSSPVPALPANAGGKICRTASALKAITKCDRHAGSTTTDPDNKAGLKLLRRVEARLAEPAPPRGVEHLQLLSSQWSQ